MNSLKCSNCGLVNFSTSSNCKRCGALIAAEYEYESHQDRGFQQPYEPPGQKPFFSGVVVVLTALLIVAFVVCGAQQAFHPFDPEAAKGIGMLVAAGGMLLMVGVHIWLVIRIFEQSVGWGVASLFLPLAGLIAVAQFWDNTKRSFVGQLICAGIMFAGIGIGA